MQSAGNVSSEDFFEDFMPYSSVEVLMMRLGKRSPIAQTVGSEQIGTKDLQNPLELTSELGHSRQCVRDVGDVGDCTGPIGRPTVSIGRLASQDSVYLKDYYREKVNHNSLF